VLKGPLYGVLGNHDSVRMVPAMEAMSIRMLFNEYEPIYLWRVAGMTGYTSIGAGTSLMPVRLNCPPEISLHTLRQTKGLFI